ncbi:CBS domain-containing protein CBSX1 chloroplastic isoform X1 [Prunus yedoensis var. nudiflora]|uniref:CBS domain-containing protein CBSX1 chloroplastic isoform X1 n=1 Tax=Prunus yedoensis var. nudiflora TaxID=2094558 RepID=A0A314XMF2_PRUYE|nr:CBS domain-containing protein CBSX1 chloroplastic isoform X1 [Prunus yedoensis var. nudiflora]
MASIFVPEPSLLPNSTASVSSPANRLPCLLLCRPDRRLFSISVTTCRALGLRRSFNVAASAALTSNSVPEKNGIHVVGDFMTPRKDLRVVKPTTTVDEAIELLVENRITGFPVIDDDWKLTSRIHTPALFVLKHICNMLSIIVSVLSVSDYDLLALDTISGQGRTDNSMFPEVDSSWKTFNKVQNLLSKTNGQVVGDLMTPAPVVVSETTNLEDVARLLLETKYRRLPVVDDSGKLVGIITRGNIIRAALQIKHASESKT